MEYIITGLLMLVPVILTHITCTAEIKLYKKIIITIINILIFVVILDQSVTTLR